MPPQARMGDNALQTAPHCHAPIHPAAPTPTPVPHPALPLPLMPPCAPTVLVSNQPAARATDMTKICTLVPCVPGGPGLVAKGSGTVMISNMPAARAGDTTSHASCVAPIPSPTGNIIPPCCPTVITGG